MTLPEGIEAIWPLAPAQAGMLFHLVSGEARPGAYVGVISALLEGPLDPERFEAAVSAAIRGRDALRAAFLHDGLETPAQVVHRDIEIPWRRLDWSERPEAEAALERLIAAERETGIDISRPPLMRLALIRLGEARHRLVWTCHHLVSDGWSSGVLLDEALARHAGAADPPRAARFRDHLAFLKRRDRAADQAFWTGYLEGFATPAMPDLPRAEAVGPFRHARRVLGPGPSGAIARAARGMRVTRATLLSAAWGLLLHRLTGESDIVFGLVSAGRPDAIPGIDRAVGAFVNTLPVRLRIAPEMTVAGFLEAAEADARARARHDLAALSDVQRWGPLPGGAPLFETLFVMEGFPPMPDRPGAPRLAAIEARDASGYPLALLATPGKTLSLDLVHDPARVPDASARALLAGYAALVEAMAGDPGRRLDALAMADEPAQTPPPPAGGPVHRAILEQAGRRAEAPALSFEGRVLSHADLAAQARALAGRLGREGIGRGDLVAIALPRGAEAVVAMLGVLAAGAACLPLDIDYPAARIRAMLEIARPRAAISTEGIRESGIIEPGITVIDPEPGPEEMPAPDGAGSGDLRVPGAEDLAYVMFTSGSQGRPKGVAVSHGNLGWSTAARPAVYGETPGVFLLLSSLAFDSSVAGLWWTLAEGGHLVISPPRIEQDPQALGRLISASGVTHLLCLPGLWQAILETVPVGDLASLRTVIVAGEAVRPGLVARHREALPGVRLFNEYGPTEATVWCAAAEITDADGPVPIGRTVPGARLVLRDAAGRPVPEALPGEIHVGGPGVARGYVGDPAASDRAFLPGPSGPEYRTGDIGLVRPDGQLLFLGRRDGQVKIRGQRIELGEIEAAAEALCPGAEAVAVTAGTGGRTLLGLFLSAPAGAEALRAGLAARLPPAMVPSRIVAPADLPRLPNGKTDRAALARRLADDTPPPSRALDRPRSWAEATLIRIWAAVLGHETVGAEDDFFALGGDSLLSIRVAALAGREGLRLAPQDIFAEPTPAGLAARLAERTAGAPDPAADAPPDGAFRFAAVNPGGTGTPVLMIHGSRQMFAALARNLGPDRPLAQVFSHHLSGRLSPTVTVEAMAAEAETLLRGFRPTGPYILAGYSLGAVVATELARRLTAAGERVTFLFLLDPSPKSVARAGGLARDIGLAAASIAIRGLRLMPAEAARYLHVRRLYHLALSRHRPVPTDLPALVLTTFETAMPPGYGAWWREVFPAGSIERMEMDHLSLQTEPAAMLAWTARFLSALRRLDFEEG